MGYLKELIIVHVRKYPIYLDHGKKQDGDKGLRLEWDKFVVWVEEAWQLSHAGQGRREQGWWEVDTDKYLHEEVVMLEHLGKGIIEKLQNAGKSHHPHIVSSPDRWIQWIGKDDQANRKMDIYEESSQLSLWNDQNIEPLIEWEMYIQTEQNLTILQFGSLLSRIHHLPLSLGSLPQQVNVGRVYWES